MNLLELATSIGVNGFLHSSELSQLVLLAANREVLELGSFEGLSAWGMAISAKHITCCDTFRANSAGQQQMPQLTTLDAFKKATARFNNVTHFVGTSEEASRSPLISPNFQMVFIDAMHDRENVKLDIQRWWPRVRPGGVLAGHDYAHEHWPGVKQAFDEIFGPAPEGTTCVTLRWVVKPA